MNQAILKTEKSVPSSNIPQFYLTRIMKLSLTALISLMLFIECKRGLFPNHWKILTVVKTVWYEVLVLIRPSLAFSLPVFVDRVETPQELRKLRSCRLPSSLHQTDLPPLCQHMSGGEGLDRCFLISTAAQTRPRFVTPLVRHSTVMMVKGQCQ